jgi:hypothetical protein
VFSPAAPPGAIDLASPSAAAAAAERTRPRRRETGEEERWGRPARQAAAGDTGAFKNRGGGLPDLLLERGRLRSQFGLPSSEPRPPISGASLPLAVGRATPR